MSAEDVVAARPEMPRGVVTLMITDVEGSTRLASRLGADWPGVLTEHGRLLRAAVAAHSGVEVDSQGDGFLFAFGSAADAVASAAAAQRELAAAAWPKGVPLLVRIGIHTGEPYLAEGRYIGLDVHRTSRIAAAGHGGQVLLSTETARQVAGGELGDDLELSELGLHVLKDFDEPERVHQLAISGIPRAFPQLKAPAYPPPRATAEHRSPFPPGAGAALGVLGPVAAWRDGQSVELSAIGPRKLLAVFALRPGDTLAMDMLVDALWQDRPPKTAAETVQVYVSRLRKLLGEVIHTVPGGYRLALPPDAIDLHRFESLWDEGRTALETGDSSSAASVLREALSLWRGAAMPELVYEDGFTHHVARLEEMRLACVEDRIDADLAEGSHARVTAEVEGLVAAHPLRERLHGQLMLALYRGGRQADALEVFGSIREQLADQLGIDPGTVLQGLQRRILQQEPSLHLGAEEAQERPPATISPRSLLLVSQASADVPMLVSVLAPLVAGDPEREMILARIVEPRPGQDTNQRLGDVRRRLAEAREQLAGDGIVARTAVFSSRQPAVDIERLASQEEVELVVLDGRPLLVGDQAGLAGAILDSVAANVALAVGHNPVRLDRRLLVPFSGNEHDWAALELAAWMARSARIGIVLAGVERDDRDASRLLSSASLVLQRTIGIDAEPLLVPRGVDGLLRAAEDAAMILTGLPDGWREKGLGEVRTAIAQRSEVPALFARRGTRPSPFAPRRSATRFTWTVSRAQGPAASTAPA